jgi:indole-3-glycerol phosphate synthase
VHILDKIVKYKKEEVDTRKRQTSVAELRNSSLFERSTNSLLSKLQEKTGPQIIAEFKRKSPSKQSINLDANLNEVTRGYSAAGAAAISILTDEHFFGGADSYLQEVRTSLTQMPLLRKEFIIDEYQIYEAKTIGADIILLITEILTKEEVTRFSTLARELDLEVLLELHSEEQLDKFDERVSYVGVNNRDLKTFEVDYERSKKLYDRLPSEVPKIAESGLSDPAVVAMLYEYGFSGFLMGEHFMRNNDPGAACAGFIKTVHELTIEKHIDE